MTQKADRPGPRGYPRYGRFIATGAVAGIAVAVVSAFLAPANEGFTRSQVLLYLAAVLGLVGGLLGGGVAVVLEGRARRASRSRVRRAGEGRVPGGADGGDSATP